MLKCSLSSSSSSKTSATWLAGVDKMLAFTFVLCGVPKSSRFGADLVLSADLDLSPLAIVKPLGKISGCSGAST